MKPTFFANNVYFWWEKSLDIPRGKLMIISAVQQNKTTVRLITDKGTRYVNGILHGYTSDTVTVKNSEKSIGFRVCNDKGQTIKFISR